MYSISSSMWRMYSCGDLDTFHLPQDIGADVRAQALGCHQFDMTSQEIFEKEREVHKTVKGVSGRYKFNEDVYIAGRGMPPGDERPEQAKPLDAQRRQTFSGALKALNNFRFARDRLIHDADTLLHDCSFYNSIFLLLLCLGAVDRQAREPYLPALRG